MKERHRPIPQGGWEALQRLGDNTAIETFAACRSRLLYWRELMQDRLPSAAGPEIRQIRQTCAAVDVALDDLEQWITMIREHGVDDPGHYWMLPALPLRFLVDRVPQKDNIETRIILAAKGRT